MNKKTDKTAIKVEHLTKTFRIPLERSSGLKQKLVNTLRGKKGYREFTPLNDISFEIEEGEFFGIVGRNGSGKSTLLKSIAGIYTPSSGVVHVKGKLVPFIELGVGFNAELTGRENVYLNGAMLGFSNKEMDAMYDEIVEFAELGEFMEESLKNYSSGMQVRLAFSIAIRAKGDVLLLDEVLAVGDSAFQKKCFDYFRYLRTQNKTVILVTHSMPSVVEFCDRALLLDVGEIKSIGMAQDIAQLYDEMFIRERAIKEHDKRKESSEQGLEKDLELRSIQLFQTGKATKHIRAHEDFTIKLSLESEKVIKSATLGVNILNSNNQIVLATGTKRLDEDFKLQRGVTTVEFDVENIYTEDTYYINIAAEDDNNKELLLKKTDTLTFDITGVKYAKQSLTHPNISIRVSNES